jgi:hypothetical protein
MYGGREALPDDHKFRGQRGRVRARYRRPQLGRGTEKIGETSQRKTNLQLASGAFSCKVAPFTPAGERTKKAPSRSGRTGSNGRQHPVVIDCEVLQKRRSRCTTPGELRATRREVSWRSRSGTFVRNADQSDGGLGGNFDASARYAGWMLDSSEIDAALDWYEQAVGQRQPGAVLVASAADFQPLCAHPRWPRLAKMMNLPQGAPPAGARFHMTT